jgi:hypothetical protein
MLNQLRAGRTQEEASAELNQLIQDCRNTGKKGTITLSITVVPDKGDTGQYFLKHQLVRKSPKFEIGDTLFWGTPDGNLLRQDPSQGELELKSVPDSPREIKFVDGATPAVKNI